MMVGSYMIKTFKTCVFRKHKLKHSRNRVLSGMFLRNNIRFLQYIQISKNAGFWA